MTLMQNLSSRRYVVGIFVTGCVLVLAFSVILYRQYSFAQQTNSLVLHDYEVLRNGHMMFTDLLSMETGVRGYLLTGDPQFLQPYDESQVWLDTEMLELKNLTKDNPAETKSIDGLEAEIKKFRAMLVSQALLLKHDGRGAITEKVLRRQKNAMDHLRQSAKSFTEPVQSNLTLKLEKLQRKEQEFVLFLVAGTVGVIAVLWLAVLAIFSIEDRRRESEAEAQATEERFRTVMNGINDGLYEYEVATERVYFSPAYKAMLGFSDDEFPNTKDMMQLLVHPDDWEPVWDVVRQYQRREKSHYINYFRMRHKDGSWRWIMSRGVGIWDQNNQLVRLIGTHTDITEQKQREEKLQELNQDLETFAYIASHDLRAPLVNLKGFAQEMEYSLDALKPLMVEAQTALSEPQKAIIQQAMEKDIPEALSFIHKSVDRMDALTTAVLDLSRIGRRELMWEAVNVQNIVSRCADSLSYEAMRKNAAIEIRNLPVIISDAHAMEQIWCNLLDNAVKYLDPERPGKIVVDCEVHMNEIIFSVRDNGRGIMEADAIKVFEIFRRARNAGDERGIGMGLASVKATIRKMGGAIWFESQLGEGTVFYVCLPLRPAAVQGAGWAEQQEKAA